MRLNLYIFFYVFCVQLGFTQNYIYQHFGVDEGLPSSEVYDIYQDKLGYIWFATDRGLSCYNGYEFKNYTTKDGLPGNTILDFYPQINGQIWCFEYHSQSLFYFDEKFNGFKKFKHNNVIKKYFNKQSIVKNIIIDKNGTLKIGGHHINGYIEINNRGIIKSYFNKNIYINSKETKEDINLGVILKDHLFFYLSHNYPKTKDVIFINSEKEITSRMDFVFLNNNKAVFIDKKLGILSKNGSINYYESQQYPIGIKKINNTSFFVGYYSTGAEIRDISGNIIEQFLPNKSVSNFLIDKEGSYWFTTIDDGVFYIKNPTIKVFSEQHISSLVKDNLNQLYVGFKNGSIGKVKKKTIDIFYRGIGSNKSFVEFDKKQNIVYGYADGCLKDYTKREKSYFLGASKLPESELDFVLASSWAGYYKLINDLPEFRKTDFRVQDVCLYKNNTLIATPSGLYIDKDNTIQKFQNNSLLASRIDDVDINNSTNTVYLATQGKGVIVYKDRFYNITKDDGLTNNIIGEVHIENDSTLWACSNTGLNRIVFKPNNTFKVTTITKADGLLSNDIDDVEIINDTVWVATKKGLCFFNKNVLKDKETSQILSLTLNKVTANKINLEKQNTKLNYKQNNINFELEAVSPKNSEHIKYLYRLKEVDNTWKETQSRNISFPSLAPGNYTFEAKALVFNNKNNLLVSYAFKILPPFWKSWWFYTLCLLSFFGLVYIFFKIRLLTYNKDITRELMRLAIKRLKRKELFYKFRSNGEDFKIPTREILFINSQGNYLDIVTQKKTYTIRCKIGDFINSTPDALEYLRVHRSFIIRIEQVSSKGKNWVVIKDQKIPVGETFLHELEKIQF